MDGRKLSTSLGRTTLQLVRPAASASLCFSVSCGFCGVLALLTGMWLQAVVLIGGTGLHEALARNQRRIADPACGGVPAVSKKP